MKKVFNKIRFHLKLIWKHPQKGKIIKGYFLLFTGLNKFISIQKENYQIYFSKNVLALNSFIDPTSRNEEEWLLKVLLNEKNTYVDIGANIGTLCLSASGSFNELDIYAFEANPNTFKALQNNIKLNQAKNIQAFQLALGEADKEIDFSNSGTDDQNGVIKNNKYSYKQIKSTNETA